MADNVKALQKLARARFFAANNLARKKNRFLNYLFLKFSSLAQEDIFSNTFGKASTAVITDFLSVDEIADMDIEDLVNLPVKRVKTAFLILIRWIRLFKRLPEALTAFLKLLTIL